ncbi:8-amino-7-oxononanoate synthase (plasmid) [Agrobacterium rosae]|uniref:8-amino-7-oxononanoate synthase n=1 Tax=Agrobacterium rosae TaxID=1972867 RepID=A0ABU4W218_9HYPH|nr:8-amino-7-oxononanoate synthase [Agrobacterium rosae]MDX8331819.1 8-amino-7-oxononanoate synthase [Agrobacterium rosae]
MMAQGLARYENTLAGLERKGRRRILVERVGADFCSNDYLALAGSRRMAAAIVSAVQRGVPVGSGGSRLLRGNHPELEALETEAAVFFATERALYFGSGFAANTALFSTLPQRGDLVVHDALVHASVHEGIRAGRARAVAAAHNDASSFEQAIELWRAEGGTGHPWIAVESLYSMDGDRAPLTELAAVAERHSGFLVIDEAHATGVFGPDGRGFATDLKNRANVVVLHTCGKALGVSGALLGASAVLCDYLVNRARGFIYSTAPSPLMAAAVRQSLRMLVEEPQRRADFTALCRFANAEFEKKLGVAGSGSQILPVLIGVNGRAVRIAARMRAEGFDIRAIRPPTVPEGTARLRIAITLNVDQPTISRMFNRLTSIIAEEKP